jgi:hypothetical protein
MRRYDIVSAIFLILSINNSVLEAPVLVQEKRQACVDVVHRPKDMITVLGKRGDEELEKMVEDFFYTGIKPPIGSSDVHASSSSAPPRPDHGSTNVVQAPEPNPASSTANPGLLMEPSSPSSEHGAWADAPSEQWWYKGDDELHGPLYTSHENQVEHVQQPNPEPSTDSYFDLNHGFHHSRDQGHRKSSARPMRIRWNMYVQQPNPGLVLSRLGSAAA